MRESILRKLEIRNFSKASVEGQTLEMIKSESDMNPLKIELDLVNKTWYVDYDFTIKSHRKIIGPFIVFGKKIVREFLKWYVKDTGVLQNNFNASAMRSLNEVGQLLEENQKKINLLVEQVNLQQNEIEGLIQEQINLEQNGIERLFKEQIETAQAEITQLKMMTKMLHEKLIDLEKDNMLLKENILVKENEIKNKEKHIENLKENLNQEDKYSKYLSYKLQRDNQEDIYEKENGIKGSYNEEVGRFDYFAFENRFRGSENRVKELQKKYLKYFIYSKGTVLDIGCGRGEFLELLSENGIQVKGVDISSEFVDYCKYKGLDAEVFDGIEFLKSQEEESLGGIFMGQVIEHMEPEYVRSLLALCYSKLKKGSHIIIETQNPKTLAIYMGAFYIDPTHTKPVHPEYIRYLFEQEKYREIEEIYSSPANDGLEVAVGENEKLNQNMEKLNSILFGYQDYAIVAKK